MDKKFKRTQCSKIWTKSLNEQMGNKMKKTECSNHSMDKIIKKETMAKKTMIVEQKLLNEACENISKLE